MRSITTILKDVGEMRQLSGSLGELDPAYARGALANVKSVLEDLAANQDRGPINQRDAQDLARSAQQVPAFWQTLDEVNRDSGGKLDRFAGILHAAESRILSQENDGPGHGGRGGFDD